MRRQETNILLLLVLALLASTLAYQVPPNDVVAIGWIGDRLFLQSSSGLRQESIDRGDWYADDLTGDSPTGRSRWTRQHARMVLPDVGKGGALTLIMQVQGWPEDRIRTHPEQPLLTIRANGHPVGEWFPTAQWETTTVVVPAEVRTMPNLTLDLESSATFTDTLRGSDPRPKGVRVASVRVVGSADTMEYRFGPVYPPSSRAVLFLMLHTLLCYGITIRLFRSSWLAFVCAAVMAGVGGIGLAFARIWMGGLFPVTTWVLVGGALMAWSYPLMRWLRALTVRYTLGNSLNYGFIIAALSWVASLFASLLASLLPSSTPAILVCWFIGWLLVLLFVLPWDAGLSRITMILVQLIEKRALLITGVIGGIWLSYQAVMVAHLPYVGHADYADNAVVARNILAGRGWVVDYVTQFYQLYDGVTRPQETWPLLQPVWIAISFLFLGESAWAAKLPNLLFSAVLLLLIVAIGTYFWNRRVGALAALLTLTNHLFFTLNIYTTSDLAFVVFVTAAIFGLYGGVGANEGLSGTRRIPWLPAGSPMLIGAGVCTGLMMLQKPSGAVIAVGLGIWLIIRIGHRYFLQASGPAGSASGMREEKRSSWDRIRTWVRQGVPAAIIPFLIWAIPALLVLSPYLVRNQILFGTPVYSTEKYDAWVLGYRGESSEAWNDIYRVYAPELGGVGVPDRSWILRWGFDHSGEKLMTQVQAVRDYLFPVWQGGGKPSFRDEQQRLVIGNEQKNLLSPVGAWLSFVGFLAAIRCRRHLLSLLLLAFVPYTIFLITYWHANEERYFLMVIPWLAMLAAWVVWGFFDRMASIGNTSRHHSKDKAHSRWTPLAGIIVCVILFQIIQPSWPKIYDKVAYEPARWAPDLIAYTWLREHTPPDAVIMTRNPWQLNWHSERPAIMIPNTSAYDTLMAIADHYQARYLVFETMQRVKGDAGRLLNRLTGAHGVSVGDTIDGFTLVYGSPTPDNRVLIYRFPERPDHAEEMRRESGESS